MERSNKTKIVRTKSTNGHETDRPQIVLGQDGRPVWRVVDPSAAREFAAAEPDSDCSDYESHVPSPEIEAEQERADREWQQAQWEKEWRECEAKREELPYWPVRRGRNFFSRERMPTKSYVDGYIYAGALNALIGAAKSGKSTLCWSMLNAALHGKEFLGKKCPKSRVLYVSEQGAVSFDTQIRERLPKELAESVMGSPNFYLLLPEDHCYRSTAGDSPIPATTWEQRMKIWKEAVANPEIRPDVFVLDTFGSYADLPFGGENDNATISKRLFDLQQLRQFRPTLGILILHHVTKAAERSKKKYLPLSAIRGGTAFAAALDNVVALDKEPEQGTTISRIRYCYRQGRLTDEAKFDLEWQVDGSYKDVTKNISGALNESQRKRVAITEAIEKNPELRKCSGRELEEALKKRGIKVGKTLCSEVLDSYREDAKRNTANLEFRRSK